MSDGASDDATAAYAVAIEDTRDTLLRRARTMRTLGLGLLAFALAGAVLAVLASPSAGAVALAALPAWGAAFLIADAIVVRAWQRRVLHAWVSGRIDVDALGQALRADARLPQPSLAAMLALLPARGGPAVVRTDAALRAGVARAFAEAATGAVRRAAAQFAGLAGLPAAVAAWAWGARPGTAGALLAAAALVALAGAGAAGAWHRRRAASLRTPIAAALGDAAADALLRGDAASPEPPPPGSAQQ